MCCIEFVWTYLASDTVGTQFSKAKRWLNPTQHGDNIDVLYTAAGKDKTFTFR